MIHVASYTAQILGILIGIPYVLMLIGLARIADWYGLRRQRLRYTRKG